MTATIYVAIVVPYNAAFHDPVLCEGKIHSDVHLVGNTIIDVTNGSANHSRNWSSVQGNGESLVGHLDKDDDRYEIKTNRLFISI